MQTALKSLSQGGRPTKTRAGHVETVASTARDRHTASTGSTVSHVVAIHGERDNLGTVRRVPNPTSFPMVGVIPRPETRFLEEIE